METENNIVGAKKRSSVKEKNREERATSGDDDVYYYISERLKLEGETEAAVDVDVGRERRSSRYHETSSSLV